MNLATFKACSAACLTLALLNTSPQSASSQPRKTAAPPKTAAKRKRATIKTAVNFVIGTTPENPVKVTLHLENVGSLEATQVRLLNGVGVSPDESTKVEQETFEHATNLSSRQTPVPPIGTIVVGQRDSMDLHVPQLVPLQFAWLKTGRSRVYVAGIVNYQDASRSYEQHFCWVFANGDPALGRKCQTHNQEKDLGPAPRPSPPKTSQ